MKDKFEKDIKQIFNQHEEAVDQNALWAGIELGISPKKDRRLIWLLPSVFLVAIALWGYVFWPINGDSPNASKIEKSFTSNSDDEMIDKKQAKLSLDIASEMEDVKLASKTEETLISNNDLTESVVSSDSASKLKSQSYIADHTTSEKKQELTENFEINSNVVSTWLKKETQTTINLVLDEQRRKKVSADPESEHSSFASENKASKKHLSAESSTRNSLFKDAYVALQTQNLVFTFESITDNLKLSEVITEKNPNLSNPNKKNSHNANKLGVLLYSGIGFGFKAYDTPNDFGQITKSMEQIQAGVAFSAYSYNDFTFLTGFQYTMLTDEFTWSGEYNGSEVTNYLEEIIYFENEEVIMSYVEEPVETTITRDILVFPKRHILSIPLIAKYTLPLGSKNMSIYGSYLLSYQMGSKEYLFNDKGVPEKYDIDGSWLNPNFEFGFAYQYPLGEKYSIYVSPYYDFISYKLQYQELYAKHENHNFGIKLGIGF